MPPKRKAAAPPSSNAVPATPTPAKQPKQDGQKAISRDLDIDLDEGIAASRAFNGFHPDVYIDDGGIIYDASLNQSNVRANNNKFYRIQLIKAVKGKTSKYSTYNRWGRVGEFGHGKHLVWDSLDAALKDFHKKFKNKSGNAWDDRDEEPKKGKYTFIQRNYEKDEDYQPKGVSPESTVKSEPEEGSKLPKAVQRLVELIFNESHFNSVLENIGYNNEKLPLGKLGESTIKKGFQHLQELSSLIKHPSLAQNKYGVSKQEAIEEQTNAYYSTIPHVFGRHRPPMIDNMDILQRETAMLDTLTDMEIASKIMKTTSDRHQDGESVSLIDQRYEQLNCQEVTPLDPQSTEFQELKKYLFSTIGHTHSIRYNLHDIFRIEREGEHERFERSEFANRPDTNRRLLWHGSRTTNFAGILSQGLRIAPPEAPVNGYMFGKGVYLADISTKSANYCMSAASGGHGLLMLCEAELGNPMHELIDADSGATEGCKKAGKIATLGVGQTIPSGWVGAGRIHESLKGCIYPDTSAKTKAQDVHKHAYLQYNEYICYDVRQIRIRYLLRFAT